MRALPIIVWLMALIFVRGCWLTLLYAADALKLVVIAGVAALSVIMAVMFYRTNRRDPHAVDYEGRKRAYEEGHHAAPSETLVRCGQLGAEEDQG